MARQGKGMTGGRRAGFSAIEIIITLVLAGILATIALPSISRNVAQDRVRRAQFVVGSQVELAYQLAARVRKPVTVTLDASTKVLTIADRSTGTAYKTMDLARTGEWALTDASISPSGGVTIFPTGIASAALTITLTNNAYSRYVRATVAGQVTKS